MDNKSNIIRGDCDWKFKNQSKKKECIFISFCFSLFKWRDNVSSKPFCCVSSDQVVQVSGRWLLWRKGACDIVLLAVTAAECSVGPRQQLDLNQSYKTHLTLSHTHTSIIHTLCLWLTLIRRVVIACDLTVMEGPGEERECRKKRGVYPNIVHFLLL